MLQRDHDVPAPPEGFVGRDQELAYLQRAVKPGRPVVVSAPAGLDGIGRTALVRQYVSRATGFDRVLSWSIPHDGPRPHVALRGWAARLGVDVEGTGRLEGLLDLLVGPMSELRAPLLVIDGVRVVDLAALRSVLSLRTPRTSVVITAEEQGVGALLGARELVLEPLLEDEAISLLQVVTGGPVPPIVAQAVLQAVADLPLGVRLAGARMRAVRADESSSVWGARVDPDRVAWLGGPVGVARAFLDVIRRLDAPTLGAFRALGASSFGPTTAELLAPRLGVDARAAAVLLTQLADRDLVSPLGEGAYEVHPRLRRYAASLAGEANEVGAWRKLALSRVIRTHGLPGAGVSATEILETVDDTLTLGTDDDVVALAARIAERLSGWCEESALGLLSRAVERAEATGHRSAARLRSRLADLRGRFEAHEEGELELEALPMEAAEALTSGVHNGFLAMIAAEGLSLEASDEDTAAEVAEEIPTQVLDLALLAAVRSRSLTLESATSQAVEAAARAETAHKQVIGWLEQGWADRAAGEEGVAGYDRLLSAARRVAADARGVRRAARTAANAKEVTAAASAAERATRGLESVLRAVAVAEAAWVSLQDAVVDADEARARRDAMARQIEADVAIATAAVEGLRKRAGTNEAPDLAAVEAAERALLELGDAAVAARAKDVDPEAAAARVRAARDDVERAARASILQLQRPLAGVEEGSRRASARTEVQAQLDRIARDVEWVSDIVAELVSARPGALQSTGELRVRAEALVGRARAERTAAEAVLVELERAEPGALDGLVERVGTHARRAQALHAEAERMRAEAEVHQDAFGETSEEVELLGRRAEAAARLASLEAGAALARRASARGAQSAAGIEGLDEEREALSATDHALRDALETARRALRAVLGATSLAATRSLVSEAEAAARASTAAADRAREAAEVLLAAADDRRRASLKAWSDEGREAATRVEAQLAGARALAADTREAIAQLVEVSVPVEALERRLRTATDRVDAASASVRDALQRLDRTRDPSLSRRIVAALGEVPSLVAEPMRELELVRSEARATLEDARHPERRRRATQAVLERARAQVVKAEADYTRVSSFAGAGHRWLADALRDIPEDLVTAERWCEPTTDLDAVPEAEWAAVEADLHARADAVGRLVDQVRGRIRLAMDRLGAQGERAADESRRRTRDVVARVGDLLEGARIALRTMGDPPFLDGSESPAEEALSDAISEAMVRGRAAAASLEAVHLASRAATNPDAMEAVLRRANALASSCALEAEVVVRKREELAALRVLGRKEEVLAIQAQLAALQQRITSAQSALRDATSEGPTEDDVAAELLHALAGHAQAVLRLRATSEPDPVRVRVLAEEVEHTLAGVASLPVRSAPSPVEQVLAEERSAPAPAPEPPRPLAEGVLAARADVQRALAAAQALDAEAQALRAAGVPDPDGIVDAVEAAVTAALEAAILCETTEDVGLAVAQAEDAGRSVTQAEALVARLRSHQEQEANALEREAAELEALLASAFEAEAAAPTARGETRVERAAVPEAVAEVSSGLEVLVDVAVQPEAVAEAEPEAVVEAEPEAVVEAEPESVVEAEPEAVIEAEPEAPVEPDLGLEQRRERLAALAAQSFATDAVEHALRGALRAGAPVQDLLTLRARLLEDVALVHAAVRAGLLPGFAELEALEALADVLHTLASGVRREALRRTLVAEGTALASTPVRPVLTAPAPAVRVPVRTAALPEVRVAAPPHATAAGLARTALRALSSVSVAQALVHWQDAEAALREAGPAETAAVLAVGARIQLAAGRPARASALLQRATEAGLALSTRDRLAEAISAAGAPTAPSPVAASGLVARQAARVL